MTVPNIAKHCHQRSCTLTCLPWLLSQGRQNHFTVSHCGMWSWPISWSQQNTEAWIVCGANGFGGGEWPAANWLKGNPCWCLDCWCPLLWSPGIYRPWHKPHSSLTDRQWLLCLSDERQHNLHNVLAKSKAAETFGDYAYETMKPQSWLKSEKNVGRTRLLSGGPLTIRTLPIQWNNFMAYTDNKDLACFLSQQLIPKAPPDNRHWHFYYRVGISSFYKTICQKIWIKAGTAKKRTSIPVHDIVQHLQMDRRVSKDFSHWLVTSRRGGLYLKNTIISLKVWVMVPH